MFSLKLENKSNFQPFEVVDRGSETQLQVGENLNYAAQRVAEGYSATKDQSSLSASTT